MKFNVGDRVVYKQDKNKLIYKIDVVWESGDYYDILHITGKFGHSAISESELDFDNKFYREEKLKQLGI